MGLYEFGRRGIIERFISRQPNPAKTRRELEKFYEQVQPIRNVRINDQFLMITDNVFLTSELCWIYLEIEPNKLFGIITLNKLCTLCIRGINNQYGRIFLGVEKDGHEMIKYLFDRLPNVYFCEITDKMDIAKLDSLWKNDRNYDWFLQRAREQHERR